MLRHVIYRIVAKPGFRRHLEELGVKSFLAGEILFDMPETGVGGGESIDIYETLVKLLFLAYTHKRNPLEFSRTCGSYRGSQEFFDEYWDLVKLGTVGISIDDLANALQPSDLASLIPTGKPPVDEWLQLESDRPTCFETLI